MSAIVAAAGRELSGRTRRWLVQATAYSAEAGPDDQAVIVQSCWGLGHALLRTGRDDAPQPLTDRRVWLVADARLDARAELISSLRGRGRAVDSGLSDPELLLSAYVVWGDAFVDRVAGDFAFALWDGARGRLVCGRDQLGVIPLHYARAGEDLLVATGVNALLLHPEVSDQLDEEAVADFLVRGYEDFSATTFRSIRRLPPAHTATWSGGDLRLRRYWRQDEWPDLLRFSSPQEYVDRFRDLLRIAVADRITGDRVATHVSGGMDSTSVAAVAAEVLVARGLPSSALRGLTMVLGGDSGDEEGEYAGLVAGATGIELDVLDESLVEPIDPLAATRVAPEPLSYRWTSTDYESLLRCAVHGRLLLTGFPGDGLLMFIPWYWLEWLAHGRIRRLLQAATQSAELSVGRPHPRLGQSARFALAVARGSTAPPAWFAPDFVARSNLTAKRRRLVIPRAARFDIRSLTREPLWTALFTSCDPTATSVPLRIRHPLADLRLLDFAARLPPDPWLIGKRILRDATDGLLPDAVRTRRKTLLAHGPRASITDRSLRGLEQLVRDTSALDQFFDRPTLCAAITAPGAAAAHSHNVRLLWALGLVHWRAHWRRPSGGDGTEQSSVRHVEFETGEGTHEWT